MNTNRRVVAGVAPVEPRPELVIWAAEEAHARGATLELVTACPPEPDNPVARAALSWAATLAADNRPGLATVTRVIPGPPEQVLCGAAIGADLLVVGADDRSPLLEAITGSVPGGLLSVAPCAMVVVPKDAESAQGTAPVVVGVDTAETSQAALDYAYATADRSGQDLQVVLCWTAPRDRAERRAECAEQQRALAVSVSGYGEPYPDVAVTEFIVDGDPTEELTRRSRRAALLVLGSRGRGRLASMAFGSVSRTLIRRSRCPVAVVKPNQPAATSMASGLSLAWDD